MSAEPAPEPDGDARRARVRVGAGAALVVVLAALAVAVLITALSPRGATTTIAPSAGPTDPTEVVVGDGSAIFVHILGEVARPGLYELSEGARAVDVVAAAGGFTDAADPAAVNLARFVADGEQIVVPAVGAAPPAGAPGTAADGRINLNTADAAALEELPRIGPTMAERIVAWREAHGPFRAVEDLLEISGIGEQTLAAVRDLVVL